MDDVLAHGGIAFEPRRRRVCVGQACVILAPQEAGLLASFLRRPGQVLGLDQLVMAIYPEPDSEPLDARQGVRIICSRLRARLRTIGVELRICSVYREGYVFDGERSPAWDNAGLPPNEMLPRTR